MCEIFQGGGREGSQEAGRSSFRAPMQEGAPALRAQRPPHRPPHRLPPPTPAGGCGRPSADVTSLRKLQKTVVPHTMPFHQSFGGQTHPKDRSITTSAGSEQARTSVPRGFHTLILLSPRKPGIKGGATFLFQPPGRTTAVPLEIHQTFSFWQRLAALEKELRSENKRTCAPTPPPPRPLPPPGTERDGLGWVG